MTPAVTPVEHVICPDDEFWTCGDIVLHEESSRSMRCLSQRGHNRMYLSLTELEQLCDIVRARDDRETAIADGWLAESKAES
jgi:hypothetical protein